MATIDERRQIYIGGGWVEPAGTETIDVFDPATEELVGRVPAGTIDDVDAAVSAARTALPGWSSTPPADRAKFIARLRDLLADRSDEMAATLTREMGAPPKIAASVQVGLPLRVLDGYVELLADFAWEETIGYSLVVKESIGVVAAITPWNYPLHQIVAKVAPALAAGAPVVLKPSELAPMSAFLFTDLMHDLGLPAGVFNLVPGTGDVVGEALAAHPGVDMVSFTGSTGAGRRVSLAAATTVKRVCLELGGKSANVLLDDADFDRAVKVGVSQAYLNSGQMCSAWTRMVVPRDRQGEVAARAGAVAEAMTAKLGPVINAAQYERVQAYIQAGIDAGAILVTGGLGRPDGFERGFCVRPTVFADVTPEMSIAQDEIFGPVLSVLPYDDDEHALAIANSTVYGLAGAVWSADVERAKAFARRMQTGQVDINGSPFNPSAPFGGVKQSGKGRELGRYGLEEFLVTKSIQL